MISIYYFIFNTLFVVGSEVFLIPETQKGALTCPRSPVRNGRVSEVINMGVSPFITNTFDPYTRQPLL